MKTRYIAHITMEADTPLKIGSSASDFIQDSPIQKDWNGLPMILGTSIAGVLRKDFQGDADGIFGKEDGSKVVFSSALLVDEDEKVHEELILEKSDFLKLFDNLPIREHTAITAKGVAKEHSKFDEEVVYKGSRFRFSLELLEDEEAFNALLKQLESPSFRLGGGSTKGFGKFKIIDIAKTTLDTTDALANYSSSLNTLGKSDFTPSAEKDENYTRYLLTIKPDDFFMFGSGFGDGDADQTAVVEKVIDYDKKGLSKNYILIPASSIKGTIAHRTAFYYNKNNNVYADNIDSKEFENHTGENNDAVKAIFGHKKEKDKESNKELGQKGKILISDCFKSYKEDTKVFDHVSIDRFTGGAIDGALFQEKIIAQKDTWEIEILLQNNIDKEYVDAFESTLNDITTGMLALGGATTKGHGIFTGEWSRS